MNNVNLETNSLAGRELTDEELMMIQGGNILGDAWNAVKSAVSAAGNAVAQGAKAVGEGLINLALNDIKRLFPRFW